MKRFAALPVLLLVGLCSHIPAVSCDTAPRVRVAAALALQALERACPINP